MKQRLSEDQKAANKEAAMLRQAAFNARSAEYREAIAQIKASDEVIQLEKKAEEVSAAESQIIEERNTEEDLIRRQIRELQDKLAGVNQKFQPRLDFAKKARSSAFDALLKKQDELRQAVNCQFADIHQANGYSSAWIPKPGYIETFAQENAEELAKKKARRDQKRNSTSQQ